MKEKELTEFFRFYNESFPGKIENFSFSVRQFSFLEFVGTSTISPLSLFPSQPVTLTGVDSNVMESIRTEYYLPGEYKDGVKNPELKNGMKDGVAPIFETNGQPSLKNIDPEGIIPGNQLREQPKIRVRKINCVYPVGLVAETGLNVDVPALFTLPTSFGNVYAEASIVHTASNVPGFWFSSYYSLVAFFNDILISMESFASLLDEIKEKVDNFNDPAVSARFYSYRNSDVQESTLQTPKTKLLVKLSPSITELERNQIKNGMKLNLGTFDILLDTIDIKK